MRLTTATLLTTFASAAPAFAQVQPVSFESFDYAAPALLQAQNGGTGWVTDWNILGMQNAVVIFSPNVNPAFPIADSIGNYAGQALEFIPAARYPSPQGHQDIHDGVGFGRDGATIWVRFRTWNYQSFGTHFGGLSLFDDSGPFDIEHLMIGSPWNSYAWGFDDEGPNGPPPVTIFGSMDTTPARIVVRIDHMAGQERVRMWVNPTVSHPTTTPDLDQMVHDFRWTKIHLNSGGSAGHYFWDEIIIEKGVPAGGGVGVNYCGPAVANSTGVPGTITGIGSGSVAANNLTLRAASLPLNSFGFFLTSRTQGFVVMPGGSRGNLCLSGSIGRYVGPGQIKNSGSIGQFELLLNLNQMPTPAGFVAAAVGDTWNFQTWHRDVFGGAATSNFTDGLSVTF
jgi:hypothetical protein